MALGQDALDPAWVRALVAALPWGDGLRVVSVEAPWGNKLRVRFAGGQEQWLGHSSVYRTIAHGWAPVWVEEVTPSVTAQRRQVREFNESVEVMRQVLDSGGVRVHVAEMLDDAHTELVDLLTQLRRLGASDEVYGLAQSAARRVLEAADLVEGDLLEVA